MKKILLIIIVSIGIINMSFSQDSSFDSLVNKLEGRWDWVKYESWAWGHVVNTPETEGYEKCIIFSKLDGSTGEIEYEYYKNETLEYSGIGALYYGSNGLNSQETWILDPPNGGISSSLSILDSNILNIAMLVTDAGYDSYQKRDTLSELNINSSLIKGLKVYESQDIVHFSTAIEEVRIYNINGQLLLSCNEPVTEINIHKLSNGLLIIKYKKERSIGVTKLLKH